MVLTAAFAGMRTFFFIVVTHSHKILEDSIESRQEYRKIQTEHRTCKLSACPWHLCRRGRFSIIALPIGKEMREPDTAR